MLFHKTNEKNLGNNKQTKDNPYKKFLLYDLEKDKLKQKKIVNALKNNPVFGQTLKNFENSTKHKSHHSNLSNVKLINFNATNGINLKEKTNNLNSESKNGTNLNFYKKEAQKEKERKLYEALKKENKSKEKMNKKAVCQSMDSKVFKIYNEDTGLKSGIKSRNNINIYQKGELTYRNEGNKGKNYMNIGTYNDKFNSTFGVNKIDCKVISGY
ncbi:MAG: hypothetical protein MJ252_27890 [archaeon]|nr:hypothetical protein [archaeon]